MTRSEALRGLSLAEYCACLEARADQCETQAKTSRTPLAASRFRTEADTARGEVAVFRSKYGRPQ